MLRLSYRRCLKACFGSSELLTTRTDFTSSFRRFTASTQCCRSTKMCSGFSCQDLSKKLTPEQYRITQEKGTERAFTGKYYDHHEVGTYTCVVCNIPLFSSQTKYDSGSGWPSFFKALVAEGSLESVERKTDSTHGMIRVEVVCRNCQAHLGHVFDDGPHPTGERFCINSASLGFEPAKQ